MRVALRVFQQFRKTFLKFRSEHVLDFLRVIVDVVCGNLQFARQV